MYELTYPYFLMLLPLPFILRHFLPEFKEQKTAVRGPFFNEYAEFLDGTVLERGGGSQSSTIQLFVLFMAWFLLLVALARPQWIEAPLVRTIPTRDLLLAVDLSGSMETEDFVNADGRRGNRLEAVKKVLDGFLEKRKGDRVGLIFFGTAPFVQVPFTEDLDVCRTLMQEAQVRMAGSQTMIGDTIGLAITIFEKSDVRDRVLILLTDGNDTGSSIPPREAAKISAEKNIVIHTVAVGDPSVAGETELDEASLREISRISQGRYFHAADRDELQDIYIQLDRLETQEVETISYRPKRDLFQWPLGALFVLTLFSQLCQAIRTQRFYDGDESNG